MPYPSTLVSNISLFTSLYPEQHGVYPPSSVLSPEIETLPERFRAAAFRTAGHTEGGFMAGGYGFARGFESFTDTAYRAETDVERTFGRGLEFLGGLGPQERFFLFLQTYATHDPYDPPDGYRSLFWSGPPPGPPPTGPTLRAVNAGELALEPRAAEHFLALYDGTIRYVDGVLERFFGELDRLGLATETTVVLTADHGEEFLEHGRVGHTQLYPECLRVPLVVVHPGLERGYRIRRLTSSVDLGPTLLDLAGLATPEGTPGESLLPALRDPAAAAPAAAYAEVIDREIARSLLVEEEGTLYQLLVRGPAVDPAGTWIERSVTFDATARRLELEAQSFHEPRRVEVTVDGAPLAPLEVTTSWQPFNLELPRRRSPIPRVTLSTETCESPLRLGVSDDGRCLSFQVRGLALELTELYDLGRDPGARRDLTQERPELRTRLLRRLAEFRLSPVAAPGAQQLSAEAEKTLRALGYLD